MKSDEITLSREETQSTFEEYVLMMKSFKGDFKKWIERVIKKVVNYKC